MGKSIGRIVVFWIVFFSLFIHGHAAEELVLKIDEEQVYLEESITVTLVGKNVENMVGTEIVLHYDASKLKMISKETPFHSNEVVDVTVFNDDLKDKEGKINLFLAWNKNTPSITQAEQVLAVLQLKAINLGEGDIGIKEGSKLIEAFEDEGREKYIYRNPQINSANRKIHIVKKSKDPEKNDLDKDQTEQGHQNLEQNPVDKNRKDVYKTHKKEIDIHNTILNHFTQRSEIYYSTDFVQFYYQHMHMLIPYGEAAKPRYFGIYYYHQESDQWIYIEGKMDENTLKVQWHPISKR